jgi:hypothetical protein
MSDVLSSPNTNVYMKKDLFLQISVRTDTQPACFSMLPKFWLNSTVDRSSPDIRRCGCFGTWTRRDAREVLSLCRDLELFFKSTKGTIALNPKVKKTYPLVTARCSYNPWWAKILALIIRSLQPVETRDRILCLWVLSLHSVTFPQLDSLFLIFQIKSSHNVYCN